MEESRGEKEKNVAYVDADLKELIPTYLSNRNKDVTTMKEALGKQDYETIRIVGHSMKGSGGGYGFDKLSEIGAVIENAAKIKSDDEITTSIDKFSRYLENVEVRYNEE